MTRDWQWLSVIAAYFLVGLALRLTVQGDALGLDEAEAFWFARNLSWGYNDQPPLYFWLQWASFQLFGEGLLAIALVKCLVLTTGLSLVYLLFRRTLPAAGAGIATLSLALVPEVFWEMQRALTHTAIVFTMVAATLIMFLRVLERRNWADYVVLGLVMGLGGLSKHNFLLLPVALLLATLTLRDLRSRLSARGVLLSAFVALVVMAPYLLWMWQNSAMASVGWQKLGLFAGDPIGLRLDGLETLLSSLIGLLGLAVIVLGPFAIRHRHALGRDMPLEHRLLLRLIAIAVLLFISLVLVLGVTNIRPRWLMPLLWPIVPLSVAMIWPLLSAGAKRILASFTVILWCATPVVLPFGESYHRADFASALEALPSDQPIGAGSSWLLGNLARLDPAAVLFDFTQRDVPGGPVILIAEKGHSATVADRLGLEVRAAPRPFDLQGSSKRDSYEWLAATK